VWLITGADVEDIGPSLVGLGLDSFGHVELAVRVEHALNVSLDAMAAVAGEQSVESYAVAVIEAIKTQRYRLKGRD
jgi:acyl carrier protein